jgi:hypothetical protein
VQSFVDAIIFNWLIAGTDAHAKNYALLLGGNGAVRLTPLYDLASILPYQTINLQKAKLAMKIGGEYRLRNIRLRHWKRFAADLLVLAHTVRHLGDVRRYLDTMRALNPATSRHWLSIAESRKLIFWMWQMYFVRLQFL